MCTLYRGQRGQHIVDISLAQIRGAVVLSASHIFMAKRPYHQTLTNNDQQLIIDLPNTLPGHRQGLCGKRGDNPAPIALNSVAVSPYRHPLASE